MSEYTLVHNPKEKLYAYHIEGHVAQLIYEEKEGVLHLTQTLVPKELGGRGIAGALVKDVFEDIKAKGLKMKPVCSYIIAYVQKHPEYKSLEA